MNRPRPNEKILNTVYCQLKTAYCPPLVSASGTDAKQSRYTGAVSLSAILGRGWSLGTDN
jgi:hypothetical protein